ncbi:hypothetical protein [Elizabethkingia anophelis]|uniref:Uncharacterized protein n=1 Tax=Elizabethkingia anophelis TaxID=1117645 RepID=A0AAU8UWE2_9FLAO|nr:hypothetical protein [Elizabethkingia anophelis]AQX02241.1 hypothetical protein BBD32_12620 [Elizabethkingia anophelis]OPB63762.1 hypothetical protein BAY11_16790 [Elizabethkingia anophelis]
MNKFIIIVISAVVLSSCHTQLAQTNNHISKDDIDKNIEAVLIKQNDILRPVDAISYELSKEKR